MSDPLREYYSSISKSYDLVNNLFTIRMDRKWRKYTAEACMAYGPSKVLDLCCGTGHLTFGLFNHSKGKVKITGYDYSKEMLQIARKRAADEQMGNIDFIDGDVAKAPFKDGEFDSITIAFGFRNLIYDNPQAETHIMEIHRVLKKGGMFFILESGIPENLFFRICHRLYLKLFLLPAGGIITGNWNAYRYLTRSVLKFPATDMIEVLTKNRKFALITSRRFFFGASCMIAFRKEG